MKGGKDIPKGFVAEIEAPWAEARARLLLELIPKAIEATRRLPNFSRARSRRLEAIRKEYAGRRLPGGRRLRLSPSTLARLVKSASGRNASTWPFLKYRQYKGDPQKKEASKAWKEQARSRAEETKAIQKAQRATLENAAPVDQAEAIRAGEAITGRKARTPEQKRLAVALLACAEIEARTTAGIMAFHTACRLAARQYGGAVFFYRGITKEIFPGNPKFYRRKIPGIQISACVKFARQCGLSGESAAREISRRFILPASSKTLQRYLNLSGRKSRPRHPAPQDKIQQELSILCGILEPRPVTTKGAPPAP